MTIKMCDQSPPSNSPPTNCESSTDVPGEILSELEHLKKENSYLRSRVRYLESGRSKCKPSKWSKVKGAFGWEKEKENLLTLKVPDSELSSSFSVSPAGSCLSHSSLTTPPPPLSSSSSEEALNVKVGRRCTSTKEDSRRKKNEENRRSKSLDGEQALCIEERVSKAIIPKSALIKGIKTPWGKVKGIIHTKSVRKRSVHDERWPPSLLVSEQGGEPEEHSLDEELSYLNAPKLTVTLPSNEELSSELFPWKLRKVESPSKLEQSGDLSPGLSRRSKWFKVRNVFLQGSRSAPSSPVRSASFNYDLGDDMSSGDILGEKDDEEHLRYEIEASYVELQNKLEDELSKKYSREVNLSPEFKKKLEEWDKMKLQGLSTPNTWNQDKERKRKEKWARGAEKESDRFEEYKDKKPYAREGSFKKHQSSHGARQEVLIPTSTGTFRFEGISDKFTRKLYEWEQARGIAPEESTFALLGPEYQPPFGCTEDNSNGGLTRSKSIGSIADPSMGHPLAQQPSSLSLNDIDERGHCGLITVTSSLVPELLGGITREPLFCAGFVSDENVRMVESSSSNEEKNERSSILRSQIVNSSYQLLQDNITLLDKLKKERDVCRQLEDDMKTLEVQINDVSKSFTDDRISTLYSPDDRNNCEHSTHYEFEIEPCHGDRLHSDESIEHPTSNALEEYNVNLRDFSKVRTTLFDDESTQTNYSCDSNLCNGFALQYEETREQSDLIRRVIGEIQELTERLELAALERDKEAYHAKNGLYHRQNGFPCRCESYGQHFSTYTLPTYWLRGRKNQELCDLTKQINEKIFELKQAFNLVATSRGCASPPPLHGGLHRTMAQDDLSPGEMNQHHQGEFRQSSRSSSASSFSYYVPPISPTNRLHHEWSSPLSFQQQLNSTFERSSPMMSETALSGSPSDLPFAELDESGLCMSGPNVFVPTMRKIFSPVSESEAVGLIIAEEDEGLEDEDFEDDHSNKSCAYEDDEEKNVDKTTNRIGPIGVIKEEEEEETEDEVNDLNANVDLFSINSAKSSSPAAERRTPTVSSDYFYPKSENGVVNVDVDCSVQEVEELKLGEELTCSLKIRALRLKRAREEFLMGDEYHGSRCIVVNEEDLLQSKLNGLRVKSTSEEDHVGSEDLPPLYGGDGGTKKRGSTILQLARRRSKEAAGLAGASASEVVEEEAVSRSCPTSPVLAKKSESGAASWIMNPAKKIFRPRGKYTITYKE